MIAKSIALAFLMSVLSFTVPAQNKSVWKTKKCAVVLTYDDALAIHLTNVIPALDSQGFKGTFYLIGYVPGFRNYINDWRTVAKNGHELGNHMLFHPCTGKRPGREWVNPNYDLGEYTFERLRDEYIMTNSLLESIDGKKKRTLAYTCGDTKIGDSSFIYLAKENFVSARGVKSEMYDLTSTIDLYNVGSYMINGQSGEELIALVKKAIEGNKLLVFLFHGVGGEHNLNVSLEAHRKLVHFLKQNEKDIWIAPFMEVTDYIKANTKK